MASNEERDSEEKERARSSARKQKMQFSHDFNNLTFPSSKGFFRVTMSSAADGVLLWLEDKKNKQQWQNTITNVSECGPQGIPDDAVIAFMKVRSPHNLFSDNLSHFEIACRYLEGIGYQGWK
jgi:hypothetical protein